MLDIISKLGPTDWVALIIGVAAFAGTIWSNIVAHRALKFAGGQQVATFRKQWIEDLRENVAEFLSCHSQIVTSSVVQKKYSALAKKSNDRVGAALQDEMLSIQSTKAQLIGRMFKANEIIKMMINEDESDHNLLEEELQKISVSPFEVNGHEKIIEITRRIRKLEWNRLVNEAKLERN